jgi:hypothetical protein
LHRQVIVRDDVVLFSRVLWSPAAFPFFYLRLVAGFHEIIRDALRVKEAVP